MRIVADDISWNHESESTVVVWGTEWQGWQRWHTLVWNTLCMDAVGVQTHGNFLQGWRNNEVKVAMGVKEHATGLPSPLLSQGHLGHKEWTDLFFWFRGESVAPEKAKLQVRQEVWWVFLEDIWVGEEEMEESSSHGWKWEWERWIWGAGSREVGRVEHLSD